MKTEQFYSSPYFVGKQRGKRNLGAYLRREFKNEVPFYSKASKKVKSGDALYYMPTVSRTLKGVSTTLYQLYYQGVPVWDNGINLTYDSESYGILSMASKGYDEKMLSKMEKLKVLKLYEKVSPDFISEALDIDRNIKRLKVLKIDPSHFEFGIKVNSEKPIIYQYKEEERQHAHKEREKGDDLENVGIFRELPHLRIPEVEKNIKEGNYYSATEVLFSTNMPWGTINWRMIVENNSGSVLYVRVFADNLGGYVYDDAPSAMTGDISILPTSPLAVLNDIRNPRALANLNPGGPPFSLNGEYVELVNLTPPASVSPTSPGNFNYDVPTQEFAAVNAYVHNDYLFRLVSDMGFDMSVYFDGTTFPVPVDHDGFFGCVNACAPGNGGGNGSGGFHYGVMQAGTTVGISLSKRITLHEFGHAVLWDNVHSPNLGFCHSVGDSLAAVLMDPRSIDPDRFMTFPWLTLANPTIDRRHDRTTATGWGWYGANDDGGYGSEQILSSCHFRLYQALGGDSEELCVREWASRYTAYLIFFSVGSLTPITNSNSPENWANVMMQSDLATVDFECHIGRVVHKVIRWAFEKQNAFNGLPPVYDVYIDDGRNGEYDYSEDICDTLDIWNRHKPDNGNENQMPICGEVNYAYVIVRNRGLENSGPAEVKAFRNSPNCCHKEKEDLCWPQDFIPLQTPSRRVDDINPNDFEIVGPFKWIPCDKNDSLLFSVSTEPDMSNIEIIRPGFSVNAMKLAQFDNNIAFRRNCNTSKCC